MFGPLQYLVIFPNENDHKFHYMREAATYIQPVDARVIEFIRKQIREGCRVQRIFNLEQNILLEKRFSIGRKPKKAKGKYLFLLEKKSGT